MAATLEQADRIMEDESLAEETLLDELESEDIPSHIREARLSQLKRMTQDFQTMKDRSHGQYTDILDEKKFLEMTTTEERCIVHFFHPDFRRCSIVDDHLKKLAVKHFNTKFARISVDGEKFFEKKLKVQVPPAIFCFIKGIVVDKVIGFDELGDEGDNFSTEELERRLMKSQVLLTNRDTKSDSKKDKSILGRGINNDDKDGSDDDDDW